MGVTGHRPHRIHGYDGERMLSLAMAALEKFEPGHVNNGFALGWDQDVLAACAWLGIPFTAYVVKGQCARWDKGQRAVYDKFLGLAKDVIVTCDENVTKSLLHRNCKIVDDSKVMLALWDKTPTGGTYATVHYALRKKTPVINLWDSWERYGGKS